MKNIASRFSDEARNALSQKLHLVLSDEYDYSADELENLYNQIVDEFPYAYDDNGNPLEMGKIFEEIIDVFSLPGGLISFN